jgi:hypothetical protein
MWEILFAPSITQKKIWRFVGACDRKMGTPLKKVISAFEKRLPSELQSMHKVGLFEPEEDDLIHLHIFSTAFLIYPFPFDEIKTFLFFDTDLEPEERAKIMNFYKRCIQCHLYIYGREKRFLSKNPSFSVKVRSLAEAFPDCRIICMVRTPLEAVPSAISWMSYGLKGYNSFDDRLLAEEIPKGISHLYFYPREQIKKLPPDRGAVLRYEDLVTDPSKFVRDLYFRFGMDIHPKFQTILEDVTEENKNYKSRHTYSLESYGLSRDKLFRDYKEIFDTFYPDLIREH